MSVGPLTFIICLVVAIFAARRWSARPSIETASPWRGLLAVSLCAGLAAVLVLVLLGHSGSRRASSDRAVAREELVHPIRSVFNEADGARRALREGMGEARRAAREGIREAGRALRDLAHTSVRPPGIPAVVPAEALDPMERLFTPQAHVSIDLNGRRAVVTESRSGRSRADHRDRSPRWETKVITLKSAGSQRLLHPLASAVIMVAMLAAAAWVLRMSVRRLPRRG